MKRIVFVFILVSCFVFSNGQNAPLIINPTVKIHTYYTTCTPVVNTYDLFPRPGKFKAQDVDFYKHEYDFTFDGDSLFVDGGDSFYDRFKVIDWQYVEDTKYADKQPYKRYIIKANRIMGYEDSLELFYFYISWNEKNQYIIQELACDSYGEIQLLSLYTNIPQN